MVSYKKKKVYGVLSDFEEGRAGLGGGSKNPKWVNSQNGFFWHFLNGSVIINFMVKVREKFCILLLSPDFRKKGPDFSKNLSEFRIDFDFRRLES